MTASGTSGRSAPGICTERKWPTLKKKIPSFKTDKEAENFVARADLTEYDLSGGKPERFEFEKKSGRVNMRLPEGLLQKVRKKAAARGIPYQRFIREAIEYAIGR